MATDWGSLLDEAEKTPIWAGDMEIGDDLHSLWWQTWDTGRMDIGVRCNLSPIAIKRRGWDDETAERETVDLQRGIVAGMVGSLVAPALEKAKADWSAEVKMPVVTEKESRGGRPYWHIQGKVVVRCSVAKELELLINAMNRYALDSGWDGLTSGQRWARSRRSGV